MKLLSCSTELIMKFILLIKVKMPTIYCLAPGRFAPKPVPPGTIPLGHFAQNFEQDCSLQNSGTIRSKINLRVDSTIFIIYMFLICFPMDYRDFSVKSKVIIHSFKQ